MAQQDELTRGQAAMAQVANLAKKAFGLRDGTGATQSGGNRSEAILEAIQALSKRQVLIGIPADTAPRDDGMLNNAARLYIHEYGAPEANIPARPTVIPGIEAARPQIDKFLAAAGRAAAAGDPNKAEQALHSAGLVAADSIKAMINSNVPPPLAESTLEDRAARGVTRTNTLIDMGEMRNAVTYVLRDK